MQAFVAQGGHTRASSPWQPRLAWSSSAASGDRNSADRLSQTFQNLFPTNHLLYGAMDLSGLQNLEDARLALSGKPGKTTSLALEAHQQYLETTHDSCFNVAGVPRTAGATVGSGQGLRDQSRVQSRSRPGNWTSSADGWPPRGVLIEAGAGHYFRGQYIRQSFRAVGSKDANYLYLRVTLNL